jgi:hypothetical protein
MMRVCRLAGQPGGVFELCDDRDKEMPMRESSKSNQLGELT